jgi:transcriptional regulator with XRE-family HTH domain
MLRSVSGLSPTVRRRRLTAELRQLREATGKTIDEVASNIGMSKSALSRIENGLVGVKIPVLRALMSEYSVTDDRALALESLAKQASQRGWWQVLGGSIPSDQYKTLVGLEAEAIWVNYYSPNIITGLLQTEEYARAVLEAVVPDATPEDLELAIQFRLKRQERLKEMRLWVILSEEGLMRTIGGPEIMVNQLKRLIAAGSGRDLTIQVIGRETGAHIGIDGGFTTIGFSSGPQAGAVYVEGHRWDACIEESDQMVQYMRSFELLRAVALSPAESRVRLETILEGILDDARRSPQRSSEKLP